MERINKFQCKIKQGPYYICVCCERGHYKNSTVLYKPDKYQIKVEDHTTLKENEGQKVFSPKLIVEPLYFEKMRKIILNYVFLGPNEPIYLLYGSCHCSAFTYWLP